MALCAQFTIVLKRKTRVNMTGKTIKNCRRLTRMPVKMHFPAMSVQTHLFYVGPDAELHHMALQQ